MDFMKILRSFEEFVYEVMTWLIFYPKTLWLTLRRPLSTMQELESEQQKQVDQQYLRAINPVLFLILSLLIVHAAELAAQDNLANFHKGSLPRMLQSDLNLLLMRSIFFGVFPLMFAVAFLRRTKQAIDRNSLRGPFVANCLTGSVFAGVISLASIGLRVPDDTVILISVLISAGALFWYVIVQSMWMKQRLALSAAPALGLSVWIILKTGIVVIAVTTVLFLA
jgi:hypothetical protein